MGAVFGVKGSTKTGVVYRSKSVALAELAEILNSRSKGRLRIDVMGMMGRLRTYRARYRNAYAKQKATGFGLTRADARKGFTQIEDKLNHMCPNYYRMHALFKGDPGARPRTIDSMAAQEDVASDVEASDIDQLENEEPEAEADVFDITPMPQLEAEDGDEDDDASASEAEADTSSPSKQSRLRRTPKDKRKAKPNLSYSTGSRPSTGNALQEIAAMNTELDRQARELEQEERRKDRAQRRLLSEKHDATIARERRLDRKAAAANEAKKAQERKRERRENALLEADRAKNAVVVAAVTAGKEESYIENVLKLMKKY